MKYALTTSSRKVKLDVEPWQLIAMTPLTHFCHQCKSMQAFSLDEKRHEFWCIHCGHILLVQQLVIEGRLSESKYRGIERA